MLCLLQLDSLDLFSAEALAQLTVQSKTIYSPSAIQMVLEVIWNQEEPLQYLAAFLEDFNTFGLKVSGTSASDSQVLGSRTGHRYTFRLPTQRLSRPDINLEDEPERSSFCSCMILISVQSLLWLNLCA